MGSVSFDLVAFGDLAAFRNGMNFNQRSDGEQIKIVGVGDFVQRSEIRDFSNLAAITANSVLGEDDLLKDGDLLFVRSNGNKALIGRCMSVWPGKERVTFSGFTIRARINEDRLDRNFARVLFQSELYRRELHEKGGGGNISNLNQEILSEFEFPLPPLREQRRIAATLSDFDHAIETTGALIEAKRLSRRFFLRKAIGSGELRRLADLVKVEMGQSPVSKSYNENQLGLPLIQGAGDFVEGYVQAKVWTTAPSKRANKNSLAMSVRAPVGTIAVIDREVCLGRGVCALVPKPKMELASLKFFVEELESYWFANKQGSTFDAVTADDVRDALVRLPRHDQLSAFGNLAADLDDELANESLKLGLLRKQRRGLIQRLLSPPTQREALAA